MTRRTSGEIVNATLLEIFLALTFLVLTVAWFEQTGLEAATAKADSLAAVSQAGNTMAHAFDSVAKTAETLKKENNELRFQSRFPPICGSSDAPLLEATLLAGGTIHFQVLRTEAGLMAGGGVDVGVGQVADQFRAVRDSSRKHGCRYRVRIRDLNTSKQEYKSAMSSLVSTFYTIDAYSQR